MNPRNRERGESCQGESGIWVTRRKDDSSNLNTNGRKLSGWKWGMGNSSNLSTEGRKMPWWKWGMGNSSKGQLVVKDKSPKKQFVEFKNYWTRRKINSLSTSDPRPISHTGNEEIQGSRKRKKYASSSRAPYELFTATGRTFSQVKIFTNTFSLLFLASGYLHPKHRFSR